MVKKNFLLAGKYFLYGVIILLLFILQSTPGFMQFYGVKPMLVIPAAICIAIYEGEFIGAILGAFGGMLCDMSAYTFFGFFSITLFLYCIATGLFIIYLMKNDLKSGVILCSAYLFAIGLIEFIFYYALWGYEGSHIILFASVLPRAVYSTALVPIFYYGIGAIWRGFNERIENI